MALQERLSTNEPKPYAISGRAVDFAGHRGAGCADTAARNPVMDRVHETLVWIAAP